MISLIVQAEHCKQADRRLGNPEEEGIEDPLSPLLLDFFFLPKDAHRLFTEEALLGFLSLCNSQNVYL